MKKLLLLALIAFIASCAPQIIPIKGTYFQPPLRVQSASPVDTVWSRVIDFFADNGLTISLIDKNSGLIVGGQQNLSFTYEKKNGALKDSTAFTVVSRMAVQSSDGTGFLKPDRVTGDWNIRIKPAPGGGTTKLLIYTTYMLKGAREMSPTLSLL